MPYGERQSEEVVRSELRSVACLLLRFMVMYGPGLPPRAMSAPTALPQPWFELMSRLLLPLKAERIGLHRVGLGPHWLQH